MTYRMVPIYCSFKVILNPLGLSNTLAKVTDNMSRIFLRHTVDSTLQIYNAHSVSCWHFVDSCVDRMVDTYSTGRGKRKHKPQTRRRTLYAVSKTAR